MCQGHCRTAFFQICFCKCLEHTVSLSPIIKTCFNKTNSGRPTHETVSREVEFPFELGHQGINLRASQAPHEKLVLFANMWRTHSQS
jgi:hypothetical protein